jgi:hypothetical protein
MDAFWWFTSQMIFVTVAAWLHHVGVIEVELWFLKWLTDTVHDLPGREDRI